MDDLEGACCLLMKGEFKAEVKYRSFKSVNKSDHVVEFFYADYNTSVTFPTIINKYLTGSRAEYLYTWNSDYDSMYEIGPGLVRDFREKCGDNFEGFYWKETENAGFYTIEDSDGKFLYPQYVQQKLAPLFFVSNDEELEEDFNYRRGKFIYNFESTDKTNAAIKKSAKDFVIALRLEKWPVEILKRFPYQEKLEELKDIPLFFVAKSFPGSPLAKLEWRISFSLVEREILLDLPNYQRKAYLNLRECFKGIDCPTYYLKTALLTISSLFEETFHPAYFNIMKFLRQVYEYLEESLECDFLPNFFVPQQNLFLLTEEKETKWRKPLKVGNQLNMPKLTFKFNYEDSVYVTEHQNPQNSCLRKNIVSTCLVQVYLKFVQDFLEIIRWTFKRRSQRGDLPSSYKSRITHSFCTLVNIFRFFSDTEVTTNDLEAYLLDMIRMPIIPENDCYKLCCAKYPAPPFLMSDIRQLIEDVEEKNEHFVTWLHEIVSLIQAELLQSKIPTLKGELARRNIGFYFDDVAVKRLRTPHEILTYYYGEGRLIRSLLVWGFILGGIIFIVGIAVSGSGTLSR